MLYTCNHSGYHNASYAATFGVVSYDWSNAKDVWAQAHPMNCEESLTKQAEMVLAEDPGIVGEQPRVWVYRNTIKVRPYVRVSSSAERCPVHTCDDHQALRRERAHQCAHGG